MFTKIHPKVKVYKRLPLRVPHWVMDKKAVTNSDRHLSHTFDIIQLNTAYDLNKCIGWK